MKDQMTTEQYKAALLKEWSEKKFQEHVIELAHARGWRVAWFRPVRVQRANGTAYYETPVGADGAGWPDLVLVRADTILFAELKRENGIRKPAQEAWAKALDATGVPVYLWRPRDLLEIERMLR